MLEGFCKPTTRGISSLGNCNYGRSWPRCRLKYILLKLNPDGFAPIIGIDALEQAPKKLIDFIDKSLLQRFNFERFLIVRTIPFERKAL